jgi:hypothetical protein
MDEVLLHISFSLKEVLEFKPIEDAVTPKRSVQSGSQHSLDHVDSSIRDYIATASSILQGIIGPRLKLQVVRLAAAVNVEQVGTVLANPGLRILDARGLELQLLL